MTLPATPANSRSRIFRKGFASGMATFDEIRLEIERTLAALKEDEGENKQRLLRRLHRLITLADQTVSGDGKVNTHLEALRGLVRIALVTTKLKDEEQK